MTELNEEWILDLVKNNPDSIISQAYLLGYKNGRVKMALLIGDKYRIEADNHNIIVSVKHIVEKTGEDAWGNSSYFSNIASALKYLVDREVLQTELKDLITIEKAIETAKQDIVKSIAQGLETTLRRTSKSSDTSG
jgi:hypothetical protein